MANTRIRFDTSMGDMTIELFDEACPITTANFKNYVSTGFYDGTIFHRVIPGFVVQGGGMLPGMEEKDPGSPIKNEAASGPSNSRGTLAMARTSDPHSATCQFFINLVDNKRLDYQGPGLQGAGYCAFGKIVEGLEAADAMAEAPTLRRAPHSDVPKDDIVLKKATIL